MNENPDHFDVLRKIQKKPETTQRELAEELGFSLGKLNYCLKALHAKGLIKMQNFKKNRIKNIQDVYYSLSQIVCFSNKFKNIEKEIRLFLRKKMYNNKNVLIKNNNGKKIVKNLYSLISRKPNKFLNKKQLKEDKNRAIADFISGMTDRYAINLYKNTK